MNDGRPVRGGAAMPSEEPNDSAEPVERAESPESEDPTQEGFFMRWIMPALFVVVTVGALWFVGRMSMPMLEADSEMPEGDHFSAGCTWCHRVEDGLDPLALLDETP
jgi:hypothetical protein